MSEAKSVLPGKAAPGLIIETLNSGTWELSQQQPEHFTVVIFYRGLHCPVCKKYLEALNGKVGEFSSRGTSVLAVSMDSEDRAKKSMADWDIGDVALGYGLSAEAARKWGLFLSESIKDAEPKRFSEPGLFLIKPDQTLYAASIQTMPFARPPLDEVLSAIDFVLEKDYPPRGDLG